MLTLFASKGSVSVASAIMLEETETKYKREFATRPSVACVRARGLL
jgi:hypothetical protein